MIVKNVTQIGDPIIRRTSKRVLNVGFPEVKKIIKNLTDSMYASNLVGMAAPQIGHNLMLFVTEIRPTKLRKTKDLDKLRVFINPKIISVSDKKILGYEGCGSVARATLFGKVSRSREVVINAVDENNNKFQLKAKGLLARVIQHEMDHLNGILFIDKVQDTKSLMDKEGYFKI